MPLWLTALLRLVADFLARFAADARRDEELKAAGRAEQRAADQKAAADAERRSAAVAEKSVAKAADDLENGEF
ncbi:hypothetical protein [Rhodopseudomonas faecalis]|uniref:hypothetical protein n=1 Tax=Rhodopseudomonas faecalis TaxID=99655 RepID=UPI000DA194B5|nr:hypothetical protein [Rhodopseudomonas faecalis]